MPDERFIEITNREIWDKLSVMEKDIGSIANNYAVQVQLNVDLQKRVRALELRFYGVLAGLIGATGTFTALLLQGGR